MLIIKYHIIKEEWFVKIAVSAGGREKSSMLDPRFGRCQYFCIFDLENGDTKYVENKGQTSSGGAGIAAAQQIIDEDVSAVVTGNMGPNAYNLLNGSGIKVFKAGNVTVEEAVNAYKEGKLEQITQSGPAHFGMGRGFGGGV